MTGLLGPSGSGKSTLMRAIVGVQKVAGGCVQVLGHPAGSPQLRTRLGYMTQAPSVYGDLTVRENLIFFARVVGQPTTTVERVLDGVSLGHGDQLVASLSGGERASLAAALLGEPELVVLDEPTVGLDPVSAAETSGSSFTGSRHKARRCSCRAMSWTRRTAATRCSCCAKDGFWQRRLRANCARRRARTTWTPPFSGSLRPGHEQVALAVALRVLGQLRHDPRTLALALVVPCMLELILQQLFGRDSPIFQQVGTPLLGLFRSSRCSW